MTKIVASQIILNANDFDAAIFDMDGVVTRTATVHAAAWKQMFDEYLEERRRAGGGTVEAFDADTDYREYVDGRPRYDGVAAFLAARGISIPWGDRDDPPTANTISGLGNRKDWYFWQRVRSDGVQAYESTLALIQRLKGAGLKAGIFSASKNAAAVLDAAGVLELFDQRVDGLVAEQLGLPGKPQPAMLIELTKRLGGNPKRTVVFEDAIAGVEAGRAGGFGLVIGINRGGRPGALRESGADAEVNDLEEVTVSSGQGT